MFENIRIVMVKTTEAGNIGAAARAMKNMALSKLYLVNPSNFPSSIATARASGADNILASAVVVDNLSKALTGVNLVIAASARQRHTKWEQLDVVQSCEKIKQISNSGGKVAVVFGTENSGLSNAELDLANVLMTIPGNSNYFSLNVASAVQVFAYQHFISNQSIEFAKITENNATFDEVEGFYQHLEQVLAHINYLEEKRPKHLIMRRLRKIFTRTVLQKDEVAILRGILRNIKPYEK